MKLAEVSIKRPIFITCIVVLMLIMGVVGMRKMSVDMFPDVTFPIIFVQTVYPGASPLDIERQISKPIEDELSSLPALEKLSSNNLESVSFVILQFRLGSDIKNLEQQVRDRMGNLRRKLPTGIKESTIRRFDPADQPIVRLAVSSNLASDVLYDMVDEQVRPAFERIQGVGLVSITGGRKKEIQVLIDKNKLQDRKLPVLGVIEKIRSTSQDIPVGKVDKLGKELTVRTNGEIESLEALRNISVSFIGSDRAVLLRDIAKVEDGLEDQKTISKLNGKTAVFIDIFKQSGANTVAVSDAVKKSVEKVNTLMKERNQDVNVVLVRDGSRPIRLNIQDVLESIIIGIILCVLVVFFFLGSARSTFITGMALPNSLLGGFVIMAIMGFSINVMTLLALSLAVGLLIDDAIVVRENIFRHMEMGKDPVRSAIDGTSEVSLAVIATTLVVIAVFGPIAFLDGIVGQFFKQFGLTIVFTMLISLFDAFTVAPMLSAYMASADEHKKSEGFIGRMLKSFDNFQTKLENIYEKTLKIVLQRPKTTLTSAFLIFILSLVLVKFISKTFIPQQDNGEFFVTVEKVSGTALDVTSKLAEDVETLLLNHKAVEIVASTIGSNDSESNKASMYVHLKEKKLRSQNTTEVKEELRKIFLEKWPSEVKVSEVDITGGNQKTFNLSIAGDNLEVLSQYVEKLKARLEKIPGLVDVDTNYRVGKPEFHVKFDRQKSESLGVSTVMAGAELRARTEGDTPAVYRKDGREYNVRVRLSPEDRDLREEFASTLVPNSNYNMIPLPRVASFENKSGFSQINRQNKNRYIMISGGLGMKGNLGDITSETERILKSELPPPKGVTYSFEGQTEDFRELLVNMTIAMIMGVIFIYLVLSSLYESFIIPLTILLAIPLAITGALIGLFVFGKSIDIFSLIGIVMLLGVVAKNSILLVDYANQLIAQGVSRNEALIKAGVTRLRPILMTSFALLAGTLPIAIGLNEASKMRTSMGVSIMSGVVSSTLLTLIVVPAAFGYIDNFNNWVKSKFRKVNVNEKH